MKEKISDFFTEHKIPVIIVSAAVLIIVIAVAAVLIFTGSSDNENDGTTGTQPAVSQSDASEEPSYTEDESESEAPGITEDESEPQSQQTGGSVQAGGNSQSGGNSQTGGNSQSGGNSSQSDGSSQAAETAVSFKDGDKTVYYPKSLENSEKKYPVIVWANGTGCPTSTYSGLLSDFAEAGYIVVADSTVMSASGEEQRDSVDYALEAAKDPDSVLYGKVNTAAVGAAGHSQGGRSAVNAAQKDSRIKCVLSIAGSNVGDEAKGLKTPVFYMTGTGDMVVPSGQWVKPAYELAEGRAVYASLKNGIHTTCMTNPEKVSGYGVKWFDAVLKNDSAASEIFKQGGQLSKDSAWQDFECKN